MKISPDTVVGEIVKSNYKAASLFEANHIDYCCGGSITISEACREVGIDPNQLITQLDPILGESDPDTQYLNDLNIDELCRYIVKRHHTYVRENIPFLEKSLEKLCEVHGESNPDLQVIRDLFFSSAGDLTKHMQKEEIVLFPYIHRMVLAHENGTKLIKPQFGSVSNPIGLMMTEHLREGERFEKIAEITNCYQVPENSCTTYAVTYKRLQDFENDLHRHIHLENNILFPKAIQFEAELLEMS